MKLGFYITGSATATYDDLIAQVVELDDAFPRLDARLARATAEPICITLISFEEQVRGWLAYIAAAKSSARRRWTSCSTKAASRSRSKPSS